MKEFQEVSTKTTYSRGTKKKKKKNADIPENAARFKTENRRRNRHFLTKLHHHHNHLNG